jgi:hypothetical protein
MLIIFLLICFNINADEKVTQTRENIRKTLLIETELVLKDESWQKEKARLLADQELLKSKKEAIQKEIQELEFSIQKTKEEAQSDFDSQKELNNKHQAVVADLKASVALLVSEPSPLPEDATLKQIAKSLQIQAANENLNPALLFDELNGFHGQWWQMGQSFQIKSGNVSIDGKEYHGEVIRLGLVYQFLLFQDHARWAYYDLIEKKWKFGKPEETIKLIKIKNILQKNEPSQLVELPKK